MEKYHVFQTYGLMKVFIDLRGGLIKSVGNGSEGECFLSTNRDVYKIYFNGFLNFVCFLFLFLYLKIRYY